VLIVRFARDGGLNPPQLFLRELPVKDFRAFFAL
jgi:hypothetical protein